MSENKPSTKSSFTPDWLVRGVLTKIGDTFDRLTGRGWKPSSSLATSELIERLKKLLDSEAEDLGEKGRFVPHNIKLKMQWDKFSTDAEKALKALETELLTAAVDHINDNLYHTYAPLKIEVKPDYFTEGVTLLVSFDEFADDDEREAEMRVTLPDMKVAELIPQEQIPPPESEEVIVRYTLNQIPKEIKLTFAGKQRLSVGRTKENNLTISDTSISKVHAALVLNSEKRLLVADTGSTNGTFINDERIAYGKAFPIETGTKVKFGTIEVIFEYVPKPAVATELLSAENLAAGDTYEVGGFEFRSSRDTPLIDEIKAVDRPTEVMSSQPIEKPNKALDVKPSENLPETLADVPDAPKNAFETRKGVVLDFEKRDENS